LRRKLQAVEERLERQARNEALLREVNERVAALDRKAADTGTLPDDTQFDFHCECGRAGGCDVRISMTLAEYEPVRGQDDRFALAEGHETPELERVVERTDRYIVVDKIEAAEPFVADERDAPSS
jgi:hypothetical protein